MEIGKFIFQTGESYLDKNLGGQYSILQAFIFITIVAIVLSTMFQYKKLFKISITLLIFGFMYEFFIPIKNNETIQNRLDKGNYFISEGKIKNFHAMPISGHDSERFDVNGTHFEIEYTGDYPNSETLFYTLTKNRNGPIQRNGQRVKIYYIEDDLTNICIPFTGRCITFNENKKNKIIKMWVYD